MRHALFLEKSFVKKDLIFDQNNFMKNNEPNIDARRIWIK